MHFVPPMFLLLLLLFLPSLPSFGTYINVTFRRPLVLWHGLGDSHSSPGMLEFKAMIRHIHPGIFIHSIYLEEDLEKDRQAGFYGNVNLQVEFAAQQLASIPELEDGFDAIGFSQGGQFLRAYVERYNSPPVHNLITFGSQHMGVSDIPLCSRYDLICMMARRAAKGAIYSPWVQENIVQAQYYRDPRRLPTYLEANHFLTSINNEHEEKNTTYKQNLASLENFVLIMFTADKTVIPKESAWFGSERPPENEEGSGEQTVLSRDSITPIRLHPMYTEDWVGLRQLDEQQRLVFETCTGEHMQMSKCWKPIVENYCGERL